MKRIFITGVNGFIGGYLAERFLREKYEVHGLMVDDKPPKVSGVIPHIADLKEYEKIGEILKEVNPDYIIHLAAKTEVEKSFYEPIEFSEINYVGTVNLIEKCRQLKDLKLFIFASTTETYGAYYSEDDVKNSQIYKRPYNENTPQCPNAPYAVAKMACEKYIEYAGRCYNLPYVILRQTNTYGRTDNDFFVVEQIITQMLKNPYEINLGNPQPYRNFLFIEDLVDLYDLLVLNAKVLKQEIFTIGPKSALQIGELAEMIAEKLNYKGQINWNKKPKRIGEVYYLNSNNHRIFKKLGWKPKTSLTLGLDKTIEIWKEKLNKN